jgi:hypothetical protein
MHHRDQLSRQREIMAGSTLYVTAKRAGSSRAVDSGADENGFPV